MLDVAPITIGAACRSPRGCSCSRRRIRSTRGRVAPAGSPASRSFGDNVWLGGGVIVCPGVTIGDNTVVGAGAVVTRDLPAASSPSATRPGSCARSATATASSRRSSRNHRPYACGTPVVAGRLAPGVWSKTTPCMSLWTNPPFQEGVAACVQRRLGRAGEARAARRCRRAASSRPRARARRRARTGGCRCPGARRACVRRGRCAAGARPRSTSPRPSRRRRPRGRDVRDGDRLDLGAARAHTRDRVVAARGDPTRPRRRPGRRACRAAGHGLPARGRVDADEALGEAVGDHSAPAPTARSCTPPGIVIGCWANVLGSIFTTVSGAPLAPGVRTPTHSACSPATT